MPLTQDIALQSALFRDIAPEAIGSIFASCPVRRLKNQEILLTPGQPNRTLYLLLNGCLQVLLANSGIPTTISLSPGECVGEMSVIDGHAVSTPVMALGDCELLAVDVDRLWKLVEEYPPLARNLLAIMAERVRNTNHALAESETRAATSQREALTDALTGAFNRRWLDEMLPRYVQRAQVARRPFALAMLDLDYFKRYNDTWGHAGGDAALRATASLLRTQLRPSDQVARYGGEEFCLLLPDTSIEQACLVADRLILATAKHPVSADPPLPAISFSLGLAALSETQGAMELLKSADAALYGAKQAGRNRYAL